MSKRCMFHDHPENILRELVIEKLGIDMFINKLKFIQKDHGIFLDLTEDAVTETYLKTFPNGTDYLSFLNMICNMTKEDTLLILTIKELSA